MTEKIRYPTLKQIDRLYEQVVRVSGGERGYLSKSNLDYLLDTVKDVGERLDGRAALVKKAAFLLYNVVTLHPFVNGNKRTAYELSRLFLRLNEFDLTSDPDKAFRFLLDVASGSVSVADVEGWIETNLTERGPA